ncbi:MAG: hypothetical protein Q8Q76_06490 [Methylotenera sp.]|nr:hypothetical protein [Methylotenera sp.]MDP3743973.1 hypothetical protein [Methylotenera sp.]
MVENSLTALDEVKKIISSFSGVCFGVDFDSEEQRLLQISRRCLI